MKLEATNNYDVNSIDSLNISGEARLSRNNTERVIYIYTTSSAHPWWIDSTIGTIKWLALVGMIISLIIALIKRIRSMIQKNIEEGLKAKLLKKSKLWFIISGIFLICVCVLSILDIYILDLK